MIKTTEKTKASIKNTDNIDLGRKEKLFKLQRDAGKPEEVFKWILTSLAGFLVIILSVFLITLCAKSWPTIKQFNISFITNQSWDPVFDEYGALPFIVGTILTSLLALIISLPFSVSLSILLGEYVQRGKTATILKSILELLAAIPSVIYGFWGLLIFVPIMRNLEMMIGVAPYGVGVLTASIILAVMIIPFSASIGSEAMKLVPNELKEAGLSLGATRSEIITKIMLPYARSGIIGGQLLSLGRALGETMAVTMVIGNANRIPDSIFAPGNTMASVIANEFTEATGHLYLSSLVEIGLLLFVITIGISMLGRWIVKKFTVRPQR